MTISEIKTAVNRGEIVHWKNPAYTVIKDKLGQYFIKCVNGHCIGLDYDDGRKMNGEEADFFTE